MKFDVQAKRSDISTSATELAAPAKKEIRFGILRTQPLLISSAAALKTILNLTCGFDNSIPSSLERPHIPCEPMARNDLDLPPEQIANHVVSGELYGFSPSSQSIADNVVSTTC